MLVRYVQTTFDGEKCAVLRLSVICKDAREVGHRGADFRYVRYPVSGRKIKKFPPKVLGKARDLFHLSDYISDEGNMPNVIAC